VGEKTFNETGEMMEKNLRERIEDALLPIFGKGLIVKNFERWETRDRGEISIEVVYDNKK
jgi:hypothetical protein